jgi:DNA-binding transcriptional LysR family regulator
LTGIDLNLLVVLDAVLAERHVARAARRLHVTPSAVSNALARLRAVIGDPLVVRAGRGVVPTPRALSLAEPLQGALRDLERSIRGDAFDPATSTARFTLAIADAGQLVRLPRIALQLARRMPRARLRVVGIEGYLSMGGLHGVEVDAAVVAVVDKVPAIHAVKLDVEETVLVVRKGNRRLSARPTRRQLAAVEHVDVHVAPGHGPRGLQAAYERRGITRTIAMVVPTFIAAAAVVSQTDLAATLPLSLVEDLGERLGLRVVGGLLPPLRFDILLAWHERTHDDPAMRAFRELVIQA